MFEELDDMLSENSSEDSWYDDGCIYAEELLGKFTNNDWQKLINSIKLKDDRYKIRLAYCVDEDTGMNGFNLLLDLLDEDDEVVEYVIDSLRSFDKNNYKKMIMTNEKIINKSKKLLKNASLPIKKMLEAFLQQNS